MKPIRRKRTLKPDAAYDAHIKLNATQVKIVNEILASGLHGNTPSQVILRLLDEQLAKYAK